MVTGELSLKKISKLCTAHVKYSWHPLCVQSLAHGVNVAFSSHVRSICTSGSIGAAFTSVTQKEKGTMGGRQVLSYMGHVVTALSTQMSVFLKRSFFYAFGPFVHTGQLQWTPRVRKPPCGMRFQVCWSGRRLFMKLCINIQFARDCFYF